MRDILVHELNRVRSMTDKQLWTRYGKMTKEDKLIKFRQALKQENRCPELRDTIAHAQGWDEAPTYTPAINEGPWTLKNASCDNDFIFEETCYSEESQAEMLVTRMVNGVEKDKNYYTKDGARIRWDELVTAGYALS